MSDDRSLDESIINLLDDAVALLRQRLQAMTVPINYSKDEEEERAFVILAVTLLAFACYSAAESMRVLIRSGVTLQLPTLVRQQFEAAIAALYICVIKPQKARDFILLDDFERFDLTTEADLSTARKREIEEECRQTLQRFPDLLRGVKNGAEILSGKLPIDRKTMKSIRGRLDFPNVREMMRALEKHDPGFSGALYTIVFRFGSLTAHPNILSLRRIFSHWDRGTPTTPSLDLREPGTLDFTLQGVNCVVGLGMILDRIVDAPDLERAQWTDVQSRQGTLGAALKASSRTEWQST